MNKKGSFGFSARRTFPFIETIGQDETTFVFEAAPKGRFVFQCFAAGVDEPVANARIFRPHRNESPHEKVRRVLIVVWNRENRLRWCDVIARRKFLWKAKFAKNFLCLCRIDSQRKSSTHVYSLYQSYYLLGIFGSVK
jgi:hypothetical protein